MIPYFFIKKKIISAIVAPHGITDLIHCVQNNKAPELFFINTACVTSSIVSSSHLYTDIGYNVCFAFGSVMHFRHDFKWFQTYKHRRILQYLLSSITILSFIFNIDLFYIYMVVLHVPNHYKNTWEDIIEHPVRNMSFIIMFISYCSYTITFPDTIQYPFILYDFYRGVIISHVIYQELYVQPLL